MPRGAAPGERRGGRAKGTRNRATIEREEKERQARELAERQEKARQAETVLAATARPAKLGKEVLEEFMNVFGGMAAQYQRQFLAGKKAAEAKFVQYGQLATVCAKELAKYQSPTYRAIMVTPAPALPAPGPVVEGKVIPINDAVAASAAYRRMVTAAKR